MEINPCEVSPLIRSGGGACTSLSGSLEIFIKGDSNFELGIRIDAEKKMIYTNLKAWARDDTFFLFIGLCDLKREQAILVSLIFTLIPGCVHFFLLFIVIPNEGVALIRRHQANDLVRDFRKVPKSTHQGTGIRYMHKPTPTA